MNKWKTPMPELPDIVVYIDALQRTIGGRKLRMVTIRSPSLLRTFEPPIESAVGMEVTDFSRLGKRVVWHFDNRFYFVFHLMIGGRYHWKHKPTMPKAKNDLAAFGFDHGTLMITEASQKKRAGLWCFSDWSDVLATSRLGIDVLLASDQQVEQMLRLSNNTLKRALTDPDRFDGIGNAYSDEILHAAKISPLKRTSQLTEHEVKRLAAAMRKTIAMWIRRLSDQNRVGFPERVTAFRPEMCVHGKFGQACPVCTAPIQRIRYADNECNYCPGCQTDGRILADRSLSRLLKDEWPRTLKDLDE